MSARMGIDIGGTFTDFAIVDERTGATTLHKLLTTPADPSLAVLKGIGRLLDAAGVRPALATALFKDGHLSLVRSAKLATMTVPQFAAHVSRLGIAVIRLDAQEAARDMDTLEQWLATS